MTLTNPIRTQRRLKLSLKFHYAALRNKASEARTLSRTQSMDVRGLYRRQSWQTLSLTRSVADFPRVLSRTKLYYSDTNRFVADLSRTLPQPSCRVEMV